MVSKISFVSTILGFGFLAGVCMPVFAQNTDPVNITYVRLADRGEGLLYEPVSPDPKANIALVNMHSASSYLNHSSCMNMAERGYRILCGNTRFTNAEEAYKGFEDHAPAINSAINFVKGIAGVTNVVLIGHSMGAPMMAFYQNIAENGASTCQGNQVIMPCDDSKLLELSAADGLILLDPHYGSAVGTLLYMDPAITDEAQPGKRDQSLDMYAAVNGYDAKGAHYNAEFQKNFLVAQAARHGRLTELAQRQWDEIQKDGGKSLYKDDMPFVVPGDQSRLFQPDLSLMHHSKKPYVLLKADGAMPKQILTSVRRPSGRRELALSNGSTLEISLRRWLGNHAIRTTTEYAQTADDLTGIVWDSSATSTPANIKTVTVPFLVMVMTGHYFIQSGELLMERSGSIDKKMVGVEGASHGITPCDRCGEVEGQFGDTVKTTYDYIDSWLAERF
jgi:pimeloyl-ACP methyl ester carboxylesterase